MIATKKETVITEEHHRVLTRRTFLTRVMTITGCAAVGLLLDGCGPLGDLTGGGPPPGPGGGGDEALAEEFKGLTTNGAVIEDLYSIHSTGVSTDEVRVAAEAFLASLSDEQREATLFAIDDDEWRKWSNVDGYQRQGVSLEEMSEAQREAAFNLLGAALSAKGLETSTNIMKLNTVEGELLDETGRFNELLYYFTVMGTPSATEPWGFQLDGHHLIINYFVLGDQVVMAPVFLGSEPPVGPAGTSYEGLSVLQSEQNKGLAMINALTEDQRSQAIIESAKTGNDFQAGAFQDNMVLDYAGISASELTADQQTQLLDLIAEWVGNMDDGHAAVKMAQIKEHLAETYFAWIGDIGADAIFYYRIQSPVILIEFDHESPGPLGQNSDYAGNSPTRNHIHSIIRVPNGNDYGKDLLRQHLQAYRHEITPDGFVRHVPNFPIDTEVS